LEKGTQVFLYHHLRASLSTEGKEMRKTDLGGGGVNLIHSVIPPRVEKEKGGRKKKGGGGNTQEGEKCEHKK